MVSCVSCTHAISVYRLRILFIVTGLFWRVRMSSTFIETIVNLLCPPYRPMFVISARLRFILECCLFVLRLRFFRAFCFGTFAFQGSGASQSCVFYTIIDLIFFAFCSAEVFYFLGFRHFILRTLCCFVARSHFRLCCSKGDIR